MKLRTVAPAAAIALAALVGSTGCKKATSNANGANTKNVTVTSNTTTLPPTTGTPTSTASAATPTEAFQLYYEALKRKDAPAIKALFSRATINMLEQEAKRKNKSFDEVFNEGLNEAGQEIPATLPESRNEKINGDHATLEINDVKKGRWDTLNFVKEGGWKVSFADEDRAGGAGNDSDTAGDDDDDDGKEGGDHSGH